MNSKLTVVSSWIYNPIPKNLEAILESIVWYCIHLAAKLGLICSTGPLWEQPLIRTLMVTTATSGYS